VHIYGSGQPYTYTLSHQHAPLCTYKGTRVELERTPSRLDITIPPKVCLNNFEGIAPNREIPYVSYTGRPAPHTHTHTHTHKHIYMQTQHITTLPKTGHKWGWPKTCAFCFVMFYGEINKDTWLLKNGTGKQAFLK